MPFEGFLDRWRLEGSVLEVRFSSGNFEDKGKDAVLYLTVDAPVNGKGIEERLSEVEPYDTEVVVQEPAVTEITVQLDYGDPIVLRGKKVRVRRADFEAEDYARLARLHHQSADLASEALISRERRIEEAKRLLADQARRIKEKVKGHKEGSTAHTLYEQQLSFISRVIQKLDV